MQRRISIKTTLKSHSQVSVLQLYKPLINVQKNIKLIEIKLVILTKENVTDTKVHH